MFTRILVPIDFSATSSAALAYARALAPAFDATLHLLHVADATLFGNGGTGSTRSTQAVMADLDTWLTDEDRARFRATATVEYRGMPAEAIVDHALANDIDLIVMGTHGHTGLAHVLLGSVAERVVRRAPCPVITLRGLPRSMADGHTGLARVLAATDFSPASDLALEHARSIVARCGARLHLLHVLEGTIETAPFAREVFVPDLPEVREARLHEATDRLTQRAGPDSPSREVTTEVVVGASAHTITDYAGKHGFDLIAMGTHGRTGIAHLLMGSVAEQVVRTAPCPVLSTRSPRPLLNSSSNQ